MGTRQATKCRFCGEGGDLYKGAHRACKADAVRAVKRAAPGANPAMYKHPSDRPTKCASCKEPPAGMSMWCFDCLNARKKDRTRRYMAMARANARKREARVEKYIPPSCACGCGAPVMVPRARYASVACRAARVPVKPVRWNRTVVQRMPEKFIGATPTLPPDGPIINPNRVEARVIPSVMKATLRNPSTGTYWAMEGE